MPQFEYKVVPAPKRGTKAKGLRATEDRFARALEDAMNTLGREGWQYLRADVLPCEERSGLTGRTTTYQSMLVFCREVAEGETKADAEEPANTDAATQDAPEEAAVAAE